MNTGMALIAALGTWLAILFAVWLLNRTGPVQRVRERFKNATNEWKVLGAASLEWRICGTGMGIAFTGWLMAFAGMMLFALIKSYFSIGTNIFLTAAEVLVAIPTFIGVAVFLIGWVILMYGIACGHLKTFGMSSAG